MYLKEKQYKIAMILLCPVQGPWASSIWKHIILTNMLKIKCLQIKDGLQYPIYIIVVL